MISQKIIDIGKMLNWIKELKLSENLLNKVLNDYPQMKE
jgi:hypothetical protein